jgi:hypothetical protein
MAARIFTVWTLLRSRPCVLSAVILIVIMQIILTEEEFAKLKETKGVSIGAIQAAKQELKRRVVSIIDRGGRFNAEGFNPSGDPFVRELQAALCKFDDEISAAIEKA